MGAFEMLTAGQERAMDERYADERRACAEALKRCSSPAWDVVDLTRYVGNIIRTSDLWPLSDDERTIVQFMDDWGYSDLLRAMSDVFPREAGRVPRGLRQMTEG